MATLANLRTAIRTRVQDPEGIRWSDSQVLEVVNQSLREMSNVLRNYVKQATVGIEAGTREVDLADMLEVVRITRGDDFPLYGPVNYNGLKFHKDVTGSEPTLWYKLGNTIGLYPEASSNYDLTLVYIAYAPALSADGDTPDSSLGPWADQFIIARSAQELYMADPDFEAAAEFGNQAMKYLIEAQSNRNQFDNTRGPVISDSRAPAEAALWLG